MLTAFVTLLLAVSAVIAPGGPPQPDLPSGVPVSISLTTQNDGRSVSLLNPAHPAWAHLAPTGAETQVTATVDLHGDSVHRWVAHLDAPDAFQGVTPDDCQADVLDAPHEVSCTFAVQVSSGVNRLLFHFTADEGRIDIGVQGTITGGQFDWNAGWEVLDAPGQWGAISNAQTISLPAVISSALRYVVTNTGDIPFRAINACDGRLIAAHAQLVCPASGVRPAQTLARSYHEQLKLVDVVGATAEPDLHTTIRSLVRVPLAPHKLDVAAAVWPWLLLLAPVVGVMVLLRLRSSRRSRRRSATA